jgi:EmrB/QacA subfamily drug resistance transporter
VVSTNTTAPDRDGRDARDARPSAAPETQISRRTWLATAVMLVAAFMELMDVTMANVAIPSIQRDLNASYEQIQWVVAGYALAFAVALMTGGRLGDIWGRKRVFLGGLLAFMITSLLSGLAPTAGFLVAMRVLQGLSAAVMLPQVLASISVWFPAEKRQAAFGLFGAVSGIGGLSAPLIGGALINANLFDLDWRPIFLINIPIGLITFIAALLLVDESRAPRALRLDPLGVLVGALGVFLVVYPVIHGRDAGWPAWIWVMLVLAIPVFALFVALERAKTRRDGSPLVDLALFRERGFAAGLLVTVVFFMGVTAVAFVLMIFLQSGFGYSALRAGVALVPLAFGLILGSGISVNMSKKIGAPVLQIGAVVSAASSVWLAYALSRGTGGLGLWSILPPLLVLGVGIGLVVAPLNDIVLAGLPHESAGSASGLQSTMIQVGNAVGVALLGVIFFGLIASHADRSFDKVAAGLQRDLVAVGLPANAANDVTAATATCFHDRTHAKDPTATPPSCRTQGGAPADGQQKVEPVVSKAATTATRDDFASSIRRTLYYDAGFFLLAGLLVFLIPRTRRPATEAVPAGAAAVPTGP